MTKSSSGTGPTRLYVISRKLVSANGGSELLATQGSVTLVDVFFSMRLRL